jgi:aminoglycoside phosphotransferase (APT) family kinase protein
MHGDMGPWNLRSMPGVGPVLFDWEHAAPAPPQADLVFYQAAARALGLTVREDLEFNEEAVTFWRERIPLRFGGGYRDDRLAAMMMRMLS